jgi:hypothetical protein
MLMVSTPDDKVDTAEAITLAFFKSEIVLFEITSIITCLVEIIVSV